MEAVRMVTYSSRCYPENNREHFPQGLRSGNKVIKIIQLIENKQDPLVAIVILYIWWTKKAEARMFSCVESAGL